MSRASDESFVAFVDKRSPELMRLALHLTRNTDEAKDLVQTALERAYRRWGRIERDTGGDPMGYVRQIVVNAHTDGLRSKQRWGRRAGERDVNALETVMNDGMLQSVAPVGRSPEHLAVQRDTLRHSLAALTPRERAAVVLRFGEDLSEVETAQCLGIAVGTVKSTVSRALAKLRIREESANPALQMGGQR